MVKAVTGRSLCHMCSSKGQIKPVHCEVIVRLWSSAPVRTVGQLGVSNLRRARNGFEMPEVVTLKKQLVPEVSMFLQCQKVCWHSRLKLRGEARQDSK
jgi:hypothetical protein